MSTNQDTTAHILLLKFHGQKALSDILQAYSEEKKKFNLKLRIYRKGLFDVIIPFVKRKGFLINGFQYHDTKTKKNETIEFYGY